MSIQKNLELQTKNSINNNNRATAVTVAESDDTMKNRKFRRCYGCKYYTSLVRERTDKNFIGICNKYNQKVIDTLCGCEVKDGVTILKNFKIK